MKAMTESFTPRQLSPSCVQMDVTATLMMNTKPMTSLPAKRRLSVLAVSLGLMAGLSGCGLPLLKHGEFDRQLHDDLASATQNRKTTQEAAIDPALLPSLPIQQSPLKKEVEPRFDLSVVAAPASQVFMALVTGTRYSMLLPTDLSGEITVKLKDVTLREALDTLRELYGYEYKIEGTRVFVQSNSLQSRVFQINYLAGRRQGSSDIRVASTTMNSSSGASRTGGSTTSTSSTGAGAGAGAAGRSAQSADTSRISTSSDADFWRDLTTSLTAIIGDKEDRSVVVNPMSGVIVVRALPAELRQVDSYLKVTQMVVERQVMLEAKIIAVELRNDTQSGINWSVFNSHRSGRGMFGVVGPNMGMNTTGNITSGSGLDIKPGKFGDAMTTGKDSGFIGLALQTANFSALLSFLETQGDVSVLSSPRIATLNNQKAVLKVGQDELYVVNVSGSSPTSTTSSGTAPEVTLQPFFSGISLDVTPQIDDDGNIILHVHPAISTVTEIERVVDLGTNSGVFKLPLPSSQVNETDSIVRVQDGNIVAIGGLMKQAQSRSRSQLPGTNNSPLGFLFGQRGSSASKTEMVVLIKPTIITSDKVWQNDLEQVNERMQEHTRQAQPPRLPKAPESEWHLDETRPPSFPLSQ